MQLHRLSVIILAFVILASPPARAFFPDHFSFRNAQAPEGGTPLMIGAGLVALAVLRRRVQT